eukprot:493594-Amorphochlora_amoeboformis.AAC.1
METTLEYPFSPSLFTLSLSLISPSPSFLFRTLKASCMAICKSGLALVISECKVTTFVNRRDPIGIPQFDGLKSSELHL